MIRASTGLLLLATLASAPRARADGAASGDARPAAQEAGAGLHPAISAGLGLSHDVLGLGLELRSGHVGGAVGLGLPLAIGLSQGGTGSLMGSLRWFRDGAAGLVLALNGGYLLGFSDLFGSRDVRAWAVSATAAWRWNAAGWFAEAGAGPALLLVRDRDHGLETHPGIDLQLTGGYEL